jgi:peptide-methionine (R)-S-oxide reductase
MRRRTVLQGLASLAAMSLASGCSGAPAPTAARGEGVERLNRPASYWRDKVTPAAYAVLFDEDTERAGSSPLNRETRAGTYVCAACHLPLFDSRDKFESGTGWPSFTQPIAGHMGTKTDYRLILPRTEYHCARCGGHQGHVFKDGPPPRGERWCNNGLALGFVPHGRALPELRG